MSNFLFLKKNNESLFNIISEAENLFRDEYFEQSIVQIRRFAENLCKDILQDKISQDDTFDSMINKIKDNSFGNTRMQEFVDDLYFLKKQGNNSAHSSNSDQNGKLALECLERAYEISIFYENTKYGYNKKLDKTVFSEEMLMTGKKTAKNGLKEKYVKELKNTRTETYQAKTKTTKGKIKNTRKRTGLKNKLLTIIGSFVLLFCILYLFGLVIDKTYILNSKQTGHKFAPHQISH